MNDPVPPQGESEGIRLLATLPHPFVAAPFVAQGASQRPENLRQPQAQPVTSEAALMPSQMILEANPETCPGMERGRATEPPATLFRFSGRGYVARLQRRGYGIIGFGGADEVWHAPSLVLAKPGADAVVKVGIDPYADPWPHYAAWCLRHPGPFRPTVRSLRWHGKGLARFFVATMDRLHTPIDLYAKVGPNNVDPWQAEQLRKGETVAKPLIAALQGWFGMMAQEGIPKGQGGLPDALCAKLSHRLAKRIRKEGLRDVASFIKTLGRTFPDHTPDPQQQNWMFTEAGKLVLVDPFTRCRRPLPETAPRLIVA